MEDRFQNMIRIGSSEIVMDQVLTLIHVSEPVQNLKSTRLSRLDSAAEVLRARRQSVDHLQI